MIKPRNGLRRGGVALLGALLVPLLGAVVVTAPAASAAAVTATCTKTSDWGTGSEGKCTVTNGTGSTASGWRVEFDLPSGTSISSSYDSVRTSSGDHHTFTNATWNGTLAAGASASFGFVTAGSGRLSGCRVNGGACDGSGGGTPTPTPTPTPTEPPTQGTGGSKVIGYFAQWGSASASTAAAGPA
ncbi:MAG: cellulose binding domain-containing protein [Actinomadura sp.]